MADNREFNDRLEELREQSQAWDEQEKKASKAVSAVEKEREAEAKEWNKKAKKLKAEEAKLLREEEKSRKKRMKKKRPPMKISLMKKMMLFSLCPLLVMGLVVTIYTIVSMKTTLKNTKLDSLSDFANSVRGGLENLDGDFAVNGGVLYIGDFAIGNQVNYLDDFSDSGVKLSVYYGDTSYLTSFMDLKKNRLTGMKLPDIVKETVLTGSKEYATDKDIINGAKYYSVYVPLRGEGGKTVGVLLACQAKKTVDAVVNKQIFSLGLIAGVILIVSVFMVAYNSYTIASTTKKMEEGLTALADGYLSIPVNLNALSRNDEIGTMARALQNTAKRMTDVVHEINSIIRRLLRAGDKLEVSSAQSSDTAMGISNSVEEISRGAISQAGDVDKANMSVTTLGDEINSIVESLSSLKESTEIMLEADKQSETIIAELFESGKQTAVALDEVTQKVNETDKAVARIQEAVSVITNIADETSLLSLNASIEAARAGEAGRGFAVVAIQIQKLAEESSKSADRISETIAELSRDSHASVQVMGEMAEAINAQQKKLEIARNQFDKVSSGISSTISETKTIYSLSQNCASERENVLDIIQSLSAVSEQNAASTESTTIAMSDLNGTISLVADSASNLQKIAHQLEENVQFFKL